MSKLGRMKKMVIAFAMVAALTVGVAVAQTAGEDTKGGRHGHFGRHGGRGEFGMMGRL